MPPDPQPQPLCGTCGTHHAPVGPGPGQVPASACPGPAAVPQVTMMTGGACQIRYPCGHTAVFGAAEPIGPCRECGCLPQARVTYAYAGLPAAG